MAVGGVGAQVVAPDVEQAGLTGPPDQRQRERPVEILGKDREDVDAHHSRPSGGSMTTTSGECSTTKTIGTSAPPSSTSRSCAGFASTASTRPNDAPDRSR